MRLPGKCSPVFLLHVFGTPNCKCAPGGLLVGGMVSVNTIICSPDCFARSLLGLG